MAVCSEIHTKHINTAVWGQNVGFVNSDLAVLVTYSYFNYLLYIFVNIFSSQPADTHLPFHPPPPPPPPPSPTAYIPSLLSFHNFLLTKTNFLCCSLSKYQLRVSQSVRLNQTHCYVAKQKEAPPFGHELPRGGQNCGDVTSSDVTRYRSAVFAFIPHRMAAGKNKQTAAEYYFV